MQLEDILALISLVGLVVVILMIKQENRKLLDFFNSMNNKPESHQH